MATIKEIGEYTFPAVIKNTLKKHSNRPALALVGEKPFTYKQVVDNAQSIANMLNKLNIAKRENIGICSNGRPEWGMAYLGIVCYERTAVPLLTDFSLNELLTIFEHSELKVLFMEKRLIEKYKTSLDKFPEIIIEIETFTIIKGPEAVLNHSILDFEPNPNLEMKADEEDIASIIYTSGTTGRSKGVMLTHKNLVWTTVQSQATHQVTPDYRILSFLPLSHVYEFTTSFSLQILNGSSIYYLGKPPIVGVLLSAFKIVKPTAILSVPLIMEKIYKNKVLPTIEKNIAIKKLYAKKISRKIINFFIGISLKKTFGGHLKFFGIGGSKIDPKVEHFMKEAKFPYAIGYGLTETSPLLAASGPEITVPGTIGVVVPGVDLRINNPNPVTGVGEIVAKGENVMKGYYKNKNLTLEAFTDQNDSVGQGYFKTGDLGLFEKHHRKNYLVLKGRNKNMILGPNGENIYPEDIEFMLNQHPLVAESLVIEQEGKLVALVQLDEERIKNLLNPKNIRDSIKKVAIDLHTSITEEKQKVLDDIKVYINSIVNGNSRIAFVKEVVAFEKTATQKIKRFLYQTVVTN